MNLSSIVTIPFVLAASLVVPQTTTQKPFEPYSGQPGKDVVWVPTSPEVVEKMMEVAKVTASDFVVDLGSGDGRNVIAAAKRGARGLGVEYNPDMVELSRRNARAAGVEDKAKFVEGDMYEAEFSQATVLALFLLPTNLDKLKEKFLALKPGSRIVLNTFLVSGWDPDVSQEVGGGCQSWCTVALYIVPAPVAGTWRLPQGDLVLTQTFQKISGDLTSNGSGTPISDGRLNGDEITFKVGGVEYRGRVNGDRIQGTAGSQSFTATRVRR